MLTHNLKDAIEFLEFETSFIKSILLLYFLNLFSFICYYKFISIKKKKDIFLDLLF